MISNSNHVELYRNFIMQGIDEKTSEFYNRRNLPMILGDPKFKHDMLKEVSAKLRKDASTDFNISRTVPTSENIILHCCGYYNVNPESLFKSQRGKVNRARIIAIYLHRKTTQLTLAKICLIFSLNSHAAVTNAVTRLEKQMRVDQSLRNDIDLINNKINLTD
jgi:chromosomal replication initiation ATPase DnaA